MAIRLWALPMTESTSLSILSLNTMKLFHQLLYVLFILFVLLGFFYLYDVTDEFLRIQAERPFELIRPHEYARPEETNI